MKGLIQKINDNWMVVLDQRTWQDPSAEDLIIPLHIDDLWVIDHTGYALGKNQELDFEITTVEDGVTDCGTHIIYNDYAKVIRRPTKKEAMTPSEILMKHEDANEMHFHEVDRKWIIEAMEEYAKEKSEKPINLEISDEQIEAYVKSTGYYGHCTPEYHEGIEKGAKWYREQLKSRL